MKNSTILLFLVALIYIVVTILCVPFLFNNGNYITVVTSALPVILIVTYIVKVLKIKKNDS
ncbi:hypothetical protein MHZ36_09395 [Staphylococcus sp. ACRSN]|uniref:hypothetical protein n=1 Tax=Staphylococcus sp. ACRSN TaxID=2918214 RepID=UPI001EF1EA33|nr:hypothetical protein [Staphylococcus sp. ACRSN]MCG7339506.1 hypothetical protein [Staphylococcus sp. ACRSN]